MIYLVADAHCDLLSKIMTDQADFSVPRPGQMVSRDGLKTGGVRLQVFALWYDPTHRIATPGTWGPSTESA